MGTFVHWSPLAVLIDAILPFVGGGAQERARVCVMGVESVGEGGVSVCVCILLVCCFLAGVGE